MNRIAYNIASWIAPILASYIMIALITSDFIPGNWSEVWQATWLIVTIQMNQFVRLKDTVNKYDIDKEYEKYIKE